MSDWSPCAATGGDHCPHWKPDGSAPCCYCAPLDSLADMEERIEKVLDEIDAPEIPAGVRERIEKAAHADCKRQGCTCEPEIEVRPILSLSGIGLTDVVARHDDDCAITVRQRLAAKAPYN